MLSNFHTHTTFCDGKSTAEEIVLSALEKGFSSLGFSGHGYTDFDLSYCMKDTEGYIKEIKQLKEKYKNEIQIYLGIEEDIFGEIKRENFDYIIGSSHYFYTNGQYLPVDSDYEGFKRCIEAFDNDILKLSEAYYSEFCDYILKRKPDIVGHFDLITKFDEMEDSLLLENEAYCKIAEKYMLLALKSNCIFEVNTGAISRGYRKSPYPSERLLHFMKKNNAKLIISSDCHEKSNLDFHFKETEKLLRDIGFEFVYTLYNNEFIKKYLK